MKFTKFIKPELEQIKENANFTEEEERIFSLLCRGFFIITKGGTFVKVAKMVAQKFTKPFGKLC